MSRSIASSVAPLKGIDGIQWLAYINNCRISIRNLPSEKGGRGLTDSGLIFALMRAWMNAMSDVQQQPITSQGIGMCPGQSSAKLGCAIYFHLQSMKIMECTSRSWARAPRAT